MIREFSASFVSTLRCWKGALFVTIESLFVWSIRSSCNSKMKFSYGLFWFHAYNGKFIQCCGGWNSPWALQLRFWFSVNLWRSFVLEMVRLNFCAKLTCLQMYQFPLKPCCFDSSKNMKKNVGWSMHSPLSLFCWQSLFSSWLRHYTIMYCPLFLGVLSPACTLLLES